MDKKISVVIPAYNEADKIAGVLQKIKNVLDKAKQKYEIIVVNDGSSDKTADLAMAEGALVVDRKKNRGYGYSLKQGIQKASTEFVLIVDADGTYDIDKIPAMISQAKDADLVVGKRIFDDSKTHRFKYAMREYFKNHTKYYANKGVEDLNSGQRIFKRSYVLEELDKYPDKFSFTSTMTVFFILKNRIIKYLPIKYRQKDRKSKFGSRLNFISIAKLAFRLTFLGSPLKFSLQLAAVFALPLMLLKISKPLIGENIFISIAYFCLMCLVLFFGLLVFVNYRGKKIA